MLFAFDYDGSIIRIIVYDMTFWQNGRKNEMKTLKC